MIAAELILQLAHSLSPRVQWTLLAPWERGSPLNDGILGSKGHPGNPDHDSQGFRNQSNPATADIVAIGDSQTYGLGVRREDAWPQQLADASGRSVYNLGFVGWGPVQYLRAAEQAIQKKPALIVVGIYLGNDLFEAYDRAYTGTLAPNLRDPLKALALGTLEGSRPIESRFSGADSPYDSGADEASHLGRAKSFVSKHFKLYSLLRNYRYMMSGEFDPKFDIWTTESREDYWDLSKQFARRDSNNLAALEMGAMRTVLSPGYRMIAVDVTDARIAEGSEVLLRAVREIQALCHKNRTGLLLVVFPTKERAFAPFIKTEGLNAVFAGKMERLAGLEDQVRGRVLGFLDTTQTGYVDALPLMQAMISKGKENPFFESRNGHFTAPAYREIASAVASHPLFKALPSPASSD